MQNTAQNFSKNDRALQNTAPQESSPDCPEYDTPTIGLQPSQINDADVDQLVIHSVDRNQQQSDGIPRVSGDESERMENPKEESVQPISCSGLWTPPWLRKASLLGFFLLFTSLWIALVVLWRCDISNSGFSIPPWASPFSWTYSPTAVLVLITGLWRQVDYHSRMHQPWQQMAAGPSPASTTILLDYVSPNLFKALLTSIRNRHWTVAATISGHTILKLVTVLSTALMVPIATEITGPVPVRINSKFDDSAFWRTTSCVFTNETTDIEFARGNERTYPRFTFGNISETSATTCLQLLQARIPDPIGTRQGIVYRNISITQMPGITKIDTISIDIDAVIPTVSCERVVAEIGYEQYNNTTQFNGTLQIKIPNCGISKMWLEVCDEFSCPLSTTYSMYRVYCSDSGLSYGPKTESRLLLLASNITQVLTSTDPKNIWLSKYSRKMSTLTAVSCRVTYAETKSNLAIDLKESTTHVHPSELSHKERKLMGLTDRRLTELLYSVLITADASFEGPPRQRSNIEMLDPSNDTSGSAALFELMSHKTGGSRKEYHEFFDADAMVTSAASILGQLAVLFIQESFLVPDNSTGTAIGTYTQRKLRFRELALWLMVASFLALSLITGSILLTFSPATPQDPSLLGWYATVMAHNPSLQILLASLGKYRTSQITYKLSGHVFHTGLDGSIFKIQPTRSHSDNLVPLANHKRKARSWLPVPARSWFVISAFILPLLPIIGLEIMYQKATKRGGFTIRNTAWTLYGTQYSSAIVMMAVSNLFNSLDFTVVTFSTFSGMRSRPVPSHIGLTNNPMREIAPVALWKALQKRSFGLILSNLAAITGSVLTIVVSNLWMGKTVLRDIEIQAPLTTAWNLDWADSAVNDGGAAVLLNNMRLNNVQSPDSAVWQDLVFPSFGTILPLNGQLPTFDYSKSDGSFNFSIDVPSLRPRLFCQEVTNLSLSVSSVGMNCVDVTKEKKEVSFEGLGDDGERFGLFFDLDMRGKVSKECSPCETRPGLERPDNPLGCPSIGILFGRQLSNSTKALACTQTVQKVQVRLNFKALVGSKGEVTLKRSDLISAPVPIESTVINMTRGDTGQEAFNYRIQPHFDLNITSPVADDPVDPFFRYILSGSLGVSRSDMLQGSEQLAKAVNRLYTDFMVQVMDSSIFRKPIVTPQDGEHEGQQTLVYGNMSMEEHRLLMNYTPKLTLQIFLGTMIVFGLVAYLLVDLKGTLPRSPHSIASVMALFAGSELCSSSIIPKGAEWMNKRELDQLFEGYLFALGWWSRDASEEDSRSTDGSTDASLRDERFGIDIGTPERYGFGETGDGLDR